LRLNVHGLRVAAGGDWDEVIDQLRLDFAWFEAPEDAQPPDVELEILRGRPDYGAFGEVPATFVTPRNVVYQHEGHTIVDYRGQAVSVLDRASGRLTVQGDNPELVHEAAYHYVLSRVGEHLDSCGLPRLHALGLAGAQGAVAILLPSGGGKSTLALRALRTEGVRLLSEDSPLMDRKGRLHPFPLRIGFNATDEVEFRGVPLRKLERMEFHPKMALEVEAFSDRVEPEPQPLAHLLIGRRTLGTEARLEPLPRRAAAATLFREAVVGVGLYQGMEFVLQRGMRDVLSQAGPASTRAAACAALVSRARIWRFTVGRDHDRNWAALEPLLSPT
jgi:hypothetical protein